MSLLKTFAYNVRITAISIRNAMLLSAPYDYLLLDDEEVGDVLDYAIASDDTELYLEEVKQQALMYAHSWLSFLSETDFRMREIVRTFETRFSCVKCAHERLRLRNASIADEELQTELSSMQKELDLSLINLRADIEEPIESVEVQQRGDPSVRHRERALLRGCMTNFKTTAEWYLHDVR
jgi:hypothetical protein